MVEGGTLKKYIKETQFECSSQSRILVSHCEKKRICNESEPSSTFSSAAAKQRLLFPDFSLLSSFLSIFGLDNNYLLPDMLLLKDFLLGLASYLKKNCVL